MEEQELHATIPLMRRTLDLLPDGVLIIGSDRNVLYLNDAFKELWQIPEKVAAQGDRAMLDHVVGQLEDPATFLHTVETLYTSPDPSEDELTFNDGRVFKRRSVALDGDHGGFSRIWIFSDFTEAWSARIDPLTGLLNRRAYSRELPCFMAAEESGRVKAFAIVDLDHFKAFNDRYGHAGGDAVLERVGLLLEGGAGLPSHKAFRIGGEEFAIASAHGDSEAALRYHQDMLRKIREEAIPPGCRRLQLLEREAIAFDRHLCPSQRSSANVQPPGRDFTHAEEHRSRWFRQTLPDEAAAERRLIATCSS